MCYCPCCGDCNCCHSDSSDSVLQNVVKVQVCGNATPPLYIHDCMPVVGVQHAPGALASCGDVRLVFTACCAGSNVHYPTQCMSMNTSAKGLGVWLWLI